MKEELEEVNALAREDPEEECGELKKKADELDVQLQGCSEDLGKAQEETAKLAKQKGAAMPEVKQFRNEVEATKAQLTCESWPKNMPCLCFYTFVVLVQVSLFLLHVNARKCVVFICLEVPFQYSFDNFCTLGVYLHNFDLHHRIACCFIDSLLDFALSDTR